ncbi:putative phage tail protein [Vallitalea guaymasensis]|uniref:putative phage tail protein n=1 Tax=Vallitalea guaymasensis TaxID=1185412 RepID=UPI002352BFBB|nr:putative phage tail protein [Vallitalea guaymasensis]
MNDTDLMQYLPDYYSGIREFQLIMEVEDKKFDDLKAHMKELYNQMFLDTATTGISNWEKDTGIQDSNSKDTLEDRRSRIRSKIRGIGKIDEQLIKDVVDSWTNDDVEVAFYEGKINIKFNSYFGIPSNIKDVQKAIDSIIPAHLGINYKIKYLLIKDIHNKRTINDLQKTKLNLFEGGTI